MFVSSGQSSFPRNQLFPEADDQPYTPRRVNRIKQVKLPNPRTLQSDMTVQHNLAHLFNEEIGAKESEPHRREDTIVCSLSELFDEERGKANTLMFLV